MEAKGQKPVKEVVNTTKISRLCVRRVASITAAKAAPYPRKDLRRTKARKLDTFCTDGAKNATITLAATEKAAKGAKCPERGIGPLNAQFYSNFPAHIL